MRQRPSYNIIPKHKVPALPLVEGEMVKCPNCGNESNRNEANFCKVCGTKLGYICRCWLKNGDSYDCGESSCPGYGLFLLDLKQAGGR